MKYFERSNGGERCWLQLGCCNNENIRVRLERKQDSSHPLTRISSLFFHPRKLRPGFVDGKHIGLRFHVKIT
ncbi:hypothetical protein CC2G_011319 [Coprinopsis cinerea AmutBmut pab1-1]|nr:hypothetical protein CC2G_011319 [Coprinopsis cinerea AmutBmut pab1-1]